MSDIEDLQERLRAFADARDWGRYHTPKNLAMALAGETGELLAEFQWLTPEESLEVMQDDVSAEAVRDELADVATYLLRLARRCARRRPCGRGACEGREERRSLSADVAGRLETHGVHRRHRPAAPAVGPGQRIEATSTTTGSTLVAWGGQHVDVGQTNKGHGTWTWDRGARGIQHLVGFDTSRLAESRVPSSAPATALPPTNSQVRGSWLGKRRRPPTLNGRGHLMTECAPVTSRPARSP